MTDILICTDVAPRGFYKVNGPLGAVQHPASSSSTLSPLQQLSIVSYIIWTPAQSCGLSVCAIPSQCMTVEASVLRSAVFDS